MKNRLFDLIKKKKKREETAEVEKEVSTPSKPVRLLRAVLNVENLSFFFVFSFVLLITLECLARRSFIDGLLFPFKSFVPFLANYAIILITLLPALFFRRRVALVTLLSALWLALGVTQFVLSSFRVTPLTGVDFSILSNVITIIDVYLKPYQIVLILTLILVALVAIIFLFIKLPKKVRAWKKCLISLSSSIAVAILIFVVGFQTNTLSDKFPNLVDAYNKYGFAYCFSLSVFDKGIDEPENYSQESINEILGEIEAGKFNDKPDTTKPNVIIVQLESFFDVNRLKDVTFSQEALPNLTHLKSIYESGLLSVPVIGAGTVNTEFEVLTGMSTSHFGPGEYPYRSILRDVTCETIAYTLAESGYTAHALHNHQATFYARNQVYPNLGFSSFTPLEFMLSPEYNDTTWAKDSVLLPEILNVMNSTEGQDFVFAVSVQGHGKYPDDYQPTEDDIYITGGITNEDRLNQFNYYLKQIQEMDAFVGALTEAVMAHDEPTLLVFYGDHLPSLSISDQMLSEGNIYQTEYVLISNYDLNVTDKIGDLYSYQIYPTVMKLIGNETGIINSFHQVCGDDEDFLEKLEMLEYDLLYGEGYAYGSAGPYPQKQDMTLGTRTIAIDAIELEDKVLYIKGRNFTEFSTVMLDGEEKNTTFIDANTLSVKFTDSLKDVKKITVGQISTKGELLFETPVFYNE